jgi:hypothetical protein
MKMKKKLLAIFLVVLTVVGRGYAQSVSKHEADFSLTISTGEESVKLQRGRIPIVVVIAEETNISSHTIHFGRSSDPGECFKMSVLLDGHPAPVTERYRKLITPIEHGPTDVIMMSTFDVKLNPGQSTIFKIPLTAYFNLGSPGRYDISFIDGTDPGQPDNVEVKSNTITITVLAADDPPPTQQ